MILNFKQFFIESFRDDERFRDRPETQNQDYNKRIAAGLKAEKKIIKELMKCPGLKSKGFTVEESAPGVDISEGIDAWLIKDGNRVGVQVKHRESSGDDIALEMIRSLDLKTGKTLVVGRDNKEAARGAKYFAVANRSKTIVEIVSADDARDYANQVLREALRDRDFMTPSARGSKTYRSHFEGHRVEIKMTTDRDMVTPKIMAYIPLDLCQTFTSCPLNIR